MANTLKLAADLSLPLTAVTEKIAFLGRTGSGKTYAAMKLAELMLDAGAQIGAIDPVGVWRALRVPAAKGGPSYEVVVFGGLYGDLPMSPTVGALVADLICDRGISFVLDVSQWIPSEQQKFVREFADRFFHRKKSSPSAVHLFMEECQEFIPENPSGEEAKTLGVMQRLWKLGRNFGIGGSLISQRPQEIAKKALNMSGTLFAFQMTGPQERKTIRAWVADHGVSVDIESVLQKLDIGQPHVESPMFLELSKTVRILPRITADLSSTPEVGVSTAAKRSLTPIDVAQLQAAMSETIERAKADDPKELRKQISKLMAHNQEQHRALEQAQTAPGKGKDVPVLTQADRELLRSLREAVALKPVGELNTHNIILDFDALFAEFERRLTRLAQEVLNRKQKQQDEFIAALEKGGWKRILEKLERVTASPGVASSHTPQHRQPNREPGGRTGTSPTVQAVPARQPGRSGDGARPADEGGLKTMHRAMLTALAQHSNGLSKKQVLIHTGYASSGPVSKAFADLARLDAVESAGALLRITQTGLRLLGDYERLPVGDALRAWLLSRMSTMEAALLRAVCEAYPNPIRKGDVLAKVGYASSGPVSKAFGKLVGLNYVRSSGPSMLVASEELFS